MSKLFNALIIILVFIEAFSMAFGVNIKKWYGWAQVSSGFLIGFLMGVSTQNVIAGIITGFFLALLTLLLGSVVWHRWQRFKGPE